jgi:heme-binding NEAT domain protein
MATNRNDDDSHISLDQYEASYHHHLDTEFRTDEDFKRDLRAALERDKREPRNPDGSRRRRAASTTKPALPTTLAPVGRPRSHNRYN